MRSQFFILFVFFATSCFAQKVISGTVLDKNGPLEGAAIYLNNSMLGTTSNKLGKFELPVKEGIYELIVSFLGYKKIVIPINTKNPLKPFRFILEEDESQLNEIVIKKTVYDKFWKRNLEVFKREFIGTSNLSKGCKILNEEVLSFYYDSIENKLEAIARKPLKIRHNDLGYDITYELETFVRTNSYITFLGFSRYKALKGSKRKKRQWKKNRLVAYNGSPVHFYKSLIHNNLTKEGFLVNQFKRVKNEERPSEEEIRKARLLVRKNRQIIVDLSKKHEQNYTALDSAWVTLRKAKLPRYKDYLYKTELKEEEILQALDGNYYFNFDNNLIVIYKNEKEESGYLHFNNFNKRTPKAQTSAIIPLRKNVQLDVSGVLFNPLEIFYEGYWSYEKFANLLPLDYVPNTEN